MIIAAYLVGYDANGQFCHLVVDKLPFAGRLELTAELLLHDHSLSPPVFDLVIASANPAEAVLCLPALPNKVVWFCEQDQNLAVLELASMNEIRVWVQRNADDP